LASLFSRDLLLLWEPIDGSNQMLFNPLNLLTMAYFQLASRLVRAGLLIPSKLLLIYVKRPGDVLQNSALISLRTTASFVGLHLFEATRPSGSIPGAWQQMQPEPHFKNITVTGMRVSFNIRFLKDDTPYSVYFVDGAI
jgi:hypothetical protein